MKQIIIATFVFLLFTPVTHAGVNLDCVLTNSSGDQMKINTRESFGESYIESDAYINFKAVDFNDGSFINSDMILDKITLKGVYSTQKDNGKTHHAMVDCNR